MNKVEFGNIILDYQNSGNISFMRNNSGFINIIYVIPKNIRIYDEIISYDSNNSLEILQQSLNEKVSQLLKVNKDKNILICDELSINIPQSFENVQSNILDFGKYDFYKEYIQTVPNIRLYCSNPTKMVYYIIRIKKTALLFNPLFNYFEDGNERVLYDQTYTNHYKTIASNYPFNSIHLTDFVLELDFKEPSYKHNINGKSVIGNSLSGLFWMAKYEENYSTNQIDQKLKEIENIRSTIDAKYNNENGSGNLFRLQRDVTRINKECREYFYLHDTVDMHIFQYQKEKSRVGIERISFPTDFLSLSFPIYLRGMELYIQEREKEKKLNLKQITNVEQSKQKEPRDFDYNIVNVHQKDAKIIHRDSHYFMNTKQLIGVTKIIFNFFPQFDAEYWAEIKAPLMGKTPQQLLEEWDRKGKESSEAGTKLHQRIDEYYHHKEVQAEDKEYLLFKQFANAYKLNPYRSEWAIYDEDSGIVGVVDFLDYSNGEYILYDWKRSEKVVEGGQPITKNKFDEHGLKPIENVPNTDYWHYALQLSFYRYILEKNYGIRIKESRLVVLHPTLNLPVVLTTPYMIDEVNKIIEVMKM